MRAGGAGKWPGLGGGALCRGPRDLALASAPVVALLWSENQSSVGLGDLLSWTHPS